MYLTLVPMQHDASNNLNAKKSLDQKLIPQKSYSKFLSLKNLQKGKQVGLYFNHSTLNRP